MGGGAEAALAAEAGRGVNPLHKRLSNGGARKNRIFKENRGTLPRHIEGRGDRQRAAARNWFGVYQKGCGCFTKRAARRRRAVVRIRMRV